MTLPLDGKRLRRIRKRGQALRGYAAEIQDSTPELAAVLDQAADDQDHLFSVLKAACGRIEHLETTPGTMPAPTLRQPSVLREVPTLPPQYPAGVEDEGDRKKLLDDSVNAVLEQASLRKMSGEETATGYQILKEEPG